MPATQIDHVVCPFCGLTCDDLSVAVDGASVLTDACPISARAYAALTVDAGCKIEGHEVSRDEAMARAAQLLGSARQPLFGGLATDVAGMRALMRLAQRVGAITDHMNASAKLRNVLALKSGPWFTTTFAEVKNRADLVLVVGGDIASRFPRFFERVVWAPDAMLAAARERRQVVFLGQAQPPAAATSPSGAAALHLRCDKRDLGDVLGVLSMLVWPNTPQPRAAGSVAALLPQLKLLAEKLRSADYAVIVWAAADFDFPHAELTVQRIAQLLARLNLHNRAAGLPLGGSDGDLTANQVHVWQSGFAFRSSFTAGYAQYDPWQHSAEATLQRNEADVLLWVTSWNAQRQPPPALIPSIVLGPSGMQFEHAPSVFMPVGTPGVDHAGHMVRADKVVTLRLGKLRESGLLSVAQTVEQIEQALP